MEDKYDNFNYLLNRYKYQLDNCLKDVKDKEKERRRIVNELIYSNKHTRFTPVEFFMLNLANKTHEEWYEYLPDLASRIIFDRLNVKTKDLRIANKYDVYCCLKKYYKRDLIKIDNLNQKELFYKFLNENKEIIVKPICGSLGNDIKIININKIKDKETYFDSLIKMYPDGMILEELIHQTEFMNRLNPTSVNTLRTTTIKMDNDIYTQSILRVGKMFSKVDNIAKGGISCSVEKYTGRIFDAVDKYGIKYINHPHTNMPLLNAVVPRYDEAVALAKEIILKLDTYRYMGFDFALTEDGWVLIELNAKASIYTVQQSMHKGLRKEFEQIFKKLNKPIDFPGMFDEEFMKEIKKQG